jgi:hypothetical protein
MIRKHKILYYRRNKYNKSRSIIIADQYIAELEEYVPTEIIDEYAYCEAFRSVLALVKETFRADHFDSVFHSGLFHWLDFEFMEWLLAHQGELKGLLTWRQVCELQCNYQGWLICGLPDMGLREIWGFNDEKQKEKLYDRLRKTTL